MMKTLLGQIYLLSQTIDTKLIDDAEIISTDVVYERLKAEVKIKIQLQRARCNAILFERLSNRNIGTNEVEAIARKITRSRQRNKCSRDAHFHKETA